MSREKIEPGTYLMDMIKGQAFDLLYGRSAASVLLVDMTETGPGYPKILRVNRGLTTNTGWTAEDLVGKSLDMLTGADTDTDVLDAFRADTRAMKATRGEIAVRVKSGNSTWVESGATPFKVDGRIISLVVHRDISDRKRTETELARRTALLQRAERLGRIGHWTWDVKTDEVFWSDEIYRIHGLDHMDPVRRSNPADYYHEEDREDFKRLMGAAKRAGKDFEFVLRIVTPDGRVRHAATKGSCRRGADGEVTEIFGVFQDVTDVHEARTALDAERGRLIDAIESIGGGVLILDRDDRVVMANRHYVTNIPGLEEIAVPGTTVEDVLRGIGNSRKAQGIIIDVDAFVAERLALYKAGHGVDAFMVSEGRWFKVEQHRMRDGGRMLIRLDVTEELRDREAMLKAKEEAEFANHSKSEFLANMSHELRTPLNAIIGFGEMMKLNVGGELSEIHHQYAADIVDSGAHLLRIINDILDLSKIEGGTIFLERAYEDIGALIDSTVPLVRQSAEEGGTRLVIEVPDGLPRLNCDVLRIKQVLLNLLSNAVKFTPGGTVTLSVAAPGKVLRIVIADDGIGMSADEIELAMTPFGQIERSHLSRQFQGTGLGLPLARKLTELHGGQFEISSRPGQGTQVALAFPLGLIGESAGDLPAIG